MEDHMDSHMGMHDTNTAVQKRPSVFSYRNIGLICVGVLAVIVLAVTVFKVSINTLIFSGALLLCPLMHLWMMKDGGHKH